MEHFYFILPLIFLVSLIYSTVGHGGASGYIIALTLFNYPLNFISTSALILNLIVSAISFLNFRNQGYFDIKILLPFLVASVPFSFVGGI